MNYELLEQFLKEEYLENKEWLNQDGMKSSIHVKHIIKIIKKVADIKPVDESYW